MEKLAVHANGAKTYLKSLKMSFETFRKALNNDTTLSEKEKELAKASAAYRKEKEQCKNKLF